jgi:hypothetical protein
VRESTLPPHWGKIPSVWLDWPVRGHGEADQAELAAEADAAVGVVWLASHLGTSWLTNHFGAVDVEAVATTESGQDVSESNSMIEPSEPGCRADSRTGATKERCIGALSPARPG